MFITMNQIKTLIGIFKSFLKFVTLKDTPMVVIKIISIELCYKQFFLFLTFIMFEGIVKGPKDVLIV